MSFIALAALPATAQFTYLIPVSGAGNGFESFFQSETLVTNLGTSDATVRFGTSYPVPGGPAGCQVVPETATLARAERTRFTPFCGAVFAYTIESTQPLAVVAAARVTFTRGNVFDCNSEQKVEVSTSPIPANAPSVIAGEVPIGESWRAKIIIVNPNDRAITATVTATRLQSRTSVTRTYSIPPRTMLFELLPEASVFVPPNDPDFIVQPAHSVRIVADGDYVAGVSYISTLKRMAEYRPAVPLAR